MYICIYVCIYIYVYTSLYVRMGLQLRYNSITPYSTVMQTPVKGSHNRWTFGSRRPTAAIQENRDPCRSRSPLVIENILSNRSINTLKGIYRTQSPIHRLSAVGLQRSLRAGSRGPYRWLNRTAAITHFPFLDMPPHQLPARSQILHRVSILVEAKPQNWDQAYQDDLWLLRGGDKYRQCKQLKIGTAHLEREDHLPDNRRLRWLQGLRQGLPHRIRLHRFRMLHHQGWDLINKWMPHQVVATSSLPTRAN